jgi:hypothetical protein
MGGIVVIAITHLEWGVVLVIKYSIAWAEPDIKHFYMNKHRA